MQAARPSVNGDPVREQDAHPGPPGPPGQQGGGGDQPVLKQLSPSESYKATAPRNHFPSKQYAATAKQEASTAESFQQQGPRFNPSSQTDTDTYKSDINYQQTYQSNAPLPSQNSVSKSYQTQQSRPSLQRSGSQQAEPNNFQPQQSQPIRYSQAHSPPNQGTQQEQLQRQLSQPQVSQQLKSQLPSQTLHLQSPQQPHAPLPAASSQFHSDSYNQQTNNHYQQEAPEKGRFNQNPFTSNGKQTAELPATNGKYLPIRSDQQQPPLPQGQQIQHPQPVQRQQEQQQQLLVLKQQPQQQTQPQSPQQAFHQPQQQPYRPNFQPVQRASPQPQPNQALQTARTPAPQVTSGSLVQQNQNQLQGVQHQVSLRPRPPPLSQIQHQSQSFQSPPLSPASWKPSGRPTSAVWDGPSKPQSSLLGSPPNSPAISPAPVESYGGNTIPNHSQQVSEVREEIADSPPSNHIDKQNSNRGFTALQGFPQPSIGWAKVRKQIYNHISNMDPPSQMANAAGNPPIRPPMNLGGNPGARPAPQNQPPMSQYPSQQYPQQPFYQQQQQQQQPPQHQQQLHQQPQPQPPQQAPYQQMMKPPFQNAPRPDLTVRGPSGQQDPVRNAPPGQGYPPGPGMRPPIPMQRPMNPPQFRGPPPGEGDPRLPRPFERSDSMQRDPRMMGPGPPRMPPPAQSGPHPELRKLNAENRRSMDDDDDVVTVQRTALVNRQGPDPGLRQGPPMSMQGMGRGQPLRNGNEAQLPSGNMLPRPPSAQNIDVAGKLQPPVNLNRAPPEQGLPVSNRGPNVRPQLPPNEEERHSERPRQFQETPRAPQPAASRLQTPPVQGGSTGVSDPLRSVPLNATYTKENAEKFQSRLMENGAKDLPLNLNDASKNEEPKETEERAKQDVRSFIRTGVTEDINQRGYNPPVNNVMKLESSDKENKPGYVEKSEKRAHEATLESPLEKGRSLFQREAFDRPPSAGAAKVPLTNGMSNIIVEKPSSTRTPNLYGDHDSGVDESTQGKDSTPNGHAFGPAVPARLPIKPRGRPRDPSAPPTTGVTSPLKSPLKSPRSASQSAPRTPDGTQKKLPMNKIQVGAAPSPNLKTVRSKIGSLQNAAYKPGGGRVKIESRKLEWKAAPKIEALNDTYVSRGGDKKIEQKKLVWNAKSKIGSLENTAHKPGGGDKKIESVKVDFKEKAKPKIGSKDNMTHKPGGGKVKIEDQKLDIKAQSKVGSLDNVKYKPGGGDKRIYDDKDYLRQMSATSSQHDAGSLRSSRAPSEGRASGTHSPIPRSPSTTRSEQSEG